MQEFEVDRDHGTREFVERMVAELTAAWSNVDDELWLYPGRCRVMQVMQAFERQGVEGIQRPAMRE